ncbi:MAG TPA: hypothetical protein VH062_10605 [Polyangiaceae bacterium]|nr:hypothetical protein [Polyangiaceae bacterium]
MSIHDELRVRPILVSSGNCAAVVGQSWRWVRDNASLLGVTIHRVRGKSFVEADALLAGIRRTASVANDGDDVGESGDELERLRAAMGKRRVAP